MPAAQKTMKRTAAKTPLNREAALLDYVERLRKFTAGRRAVHIRLSGLRPYNRREHHLRIAANTFDRLIREYETAFFRLFNDDLVVICSGATVADIDRSVLNLRYLFSDDPLLKDDETGREPFCTWFDLEEDYGELLALARRMNDARARHDRAATEEAAAIGPREAPRRPLEPAQLAIVEAAIAQADLSTMIRRQPICAVVPGKRPEPVYNEIFTSIESLRQTLIPDTDLYSDRWLFQHLTLHLDRRMIAYLSRADDTALRRSFSINLNVSTLLSPGFLEFDEALNGETRRSIVIELQMMDILSDLGNFLFARDFLRERGYRFCLDCMSHLHLPLVDRARLGIDLVKLLWSGDLLDQLGGPRGTALQEAIARTGPERLILARCDSEHALDVGHSLGIALYQGYLLDRMIAEEISRSEQIQSLTEAMARHRAAQRA